MFYQEFTPDSRLRPYVKCYYTYEAGTGMDFTDTVFPSGCMEIIFNLGAGSWQTADTTHPPIELWGQLLQPLPISSFGVNVMVGVRFNPHGAADLLKEPLDRFNDRVTDLSAVAGPEVTALHNRLLEAKTWPQRLALLETFLLGRFGAQTSRQNPIVNDLLGELRQPDTADNIGNLAARYGISSRYLLKLFVQHTGLTPKLYSKISRFQHSLRLVTKRHASLTSIAYDCGYFDQSHFIREFKTFTGLTPSGYLQQPSPVTLALAGA